MPHGEDLTIVNAFYGDENCFVWIQPLGDYMKISFKQTPSDLLEKCILWIQKPMRYTLLDGIRGNYVPRRQHTTKSEIP